MNAPPPRYDGSTFDAYRPESDSQRAALEEARMFAARVRRQLGGPTWRRGLRRLGRTIAGPHHHDGLGGGLYLVGPVGTGKTHLLAAIYYAVTQKEGVHPAVPAAFVHSSALFRAIATPEVYARDIAESARVLLIDEVELDDPAAEVRLIGVLRTLRRLGVVVAATSNVEPDRFMSSAFGRGRLDRFISEDFKRTYHVVFVGGDDYRLRQPRLGKAFIGNDADARLREEMAGLDGMQGYFRFPDLMARATDTERTALASELATLDALCLESVEIDGTDDALRLLRLLDDLYAAPEAPTLFLSSSNPPSAWFPVEDQPAGLARAVAEKFRRTVSRIEGLVEIVDADRLRTDGPDS